MPGERTGTSAKNYKKVKDLSKKELKRKNRGCQITSIKASLHYEKTFRSLKMRYFINY